MSKRLLMASAGLNVALAGVAMLVVFRAPPATNPSAQETPREVTQKVSRVKLVQEPDEVIRLDWRAIESGDYATYIKNLRAAGCPEETVRDIVIADINKHFARRWREMNPVREYKYWRHGRSSGDDPTREAASRRKALEALLREKRELVRALVGVDLAEDGERYADPSFRGSNADMAALEFLSVEKRDLLRQVRDKYEAQIQQINSNLDPDNYMPPEVRGQLAALRGQAEAEIRESLTPAEWEQFQLRFSDTAQNLRNALAGFEPSEEEFRRMFELRKAVDDQFRGLDPGDREAQRQRAEAYRQLNERYREALTPERYASFQMSQEPAYRQALGFVYAWDLPKETAARLYEVQRSAQEQARGVQAATAAERQLAVERLRAQVEASLGELLGEKALAAYKRNQPWLRAMQ
ncbi:MAG: hypothetical protein AB1705_07830 [Verrucomicrobiota bacterium]